MGSDELIAKFNAIRKEVMDVVEKYKAAGKPKGFMEVFKFLFGVTGDLVEIAEVSAELVKTDKKETVIAAVQYAYTQLDPDLPWIPEPFETKIETWFLEHAVPAFIDWIVDRYNAKGIFSHGDGNTGKELAGNTLQPELG